MAITLCSSYFFISTVRYFYMKNYCKVNYVNNEKICINQLHCLKQPGFLLFCSILIFKSLFRWSGWNGWLTFLLLIWSRNYYSEYFKIYTVVLYLGCCDSEPQSQPWTLGGSRSHQTFSFFPNTLVPLRWVTARSTAYSSAISTSAVPGMLFINFTCKHHQSGPDKNTL